MNLQMQERLEEVRSKIRSACTKAGRAESEVTLVAVSKTKPWEAIAAFAGLGVKVFGENYVQEALEKQKLAAANQLQGIEWHLIGTLQSNKAKFIPGAFSLFHALDSQSLAEKLNKAAAANGIVQSCLLEVNVDQEASKGGLASEALVKFLERLNELQNIRVSGLMCIPAPRKIEDSREPFARLRQLLELLNTTCCYRHRLSMLSMGMSADYEAAILEGATLVRVGTSLFGERAAR